MHANEFAEAAKSSLRDANAPKWDAAPCGCIATAQRLYAIPWNQAVPADNLKLLRQRQHLPMGRRRFGIQGTFKRCSLRSSARCASQLAASFRPAGGTERPGLAAEGDEASKLSEDTVQ